MGQPIGGHLEAHEVAAFVDGTLPEDARAIAGEHLAVCSDCRAEAVEVSRIVRTVPHARSARSGVHRRVWIPAVAAALILLWVVPGGVPDQPTTAHREGALTMTIAPRPLAPVGTVDSVDTLVWSAVPLADRYRVRLFDADGTVIWERETPDTTAALAAGVVLRARESYYWEVDAHTGYGRWTDSELVQFMTPVP